MPTNPDELERLRAALVDRFERHPPSTWSDTLLAAVVAVIDVEYDSPPPSQQPGLRRLSLVPKPSNR
ncbi:MAG: hypothetical protein ACPGVG_13950 [Mycobacterium sp.]